MTVAAAQGAADSAANLVQSVDWLAIAPPALTAAVALAVLVADLFVPARRKPLLGVLSVAGLAAALLLLIPLRAGDRSTFCLTAEPGVCSYTADHFTLVIQLLVLGGALLTALLSVTELDGGKNTGKGSRRANSGSCCSPRPPAPPSCPRPATSPPSSSPSKSPPSPPSRWSASSAATASPPRRR